jgi:hypothetical protein
LLAGHRDHMGDVDHSQEHHASVWPWRSKSGVRRPGAGRRIRRDLIVLAVSLAVFAGCAVIAANGRVGPAERAAFHAINGLPGWLYRPMLAAQYLGVLGMPLIFAAGALVWRRWRLAAALVLVVPLSSSWSRWPSCWCSGSGPGQRCRTRFCAGCRTPD